MLSLAEIAISACRDSAEACRRCLSLPEIAVFVLNLSDIIFLQTAPHTRCERITNGSIIKCERFAFARIVVIPDGSGRI